MPVLKHNIVIGLPETAKLLVKPDSDGDADSELDDDLEQVNDYVVYFINETSLYQSPLLEVKVENKFVIHAILDSGSEANIISQNVYERLTRAGAKILTLPVQRVVLVTAFGRKSNRIRVQAFVEFTVGNDQFECVFMVSSELRGDAIIGCQFMREHGMCIDFSRGLISYVKGDELKMHKFVTKVGIQSSTNSDCGEVREIILSNDPSTVQRHPTLAADCNNNPNPTGMVHSYPSVSNPQTQTEGQACGESECDGCSTFSNLFPERTISVSTGDGSLEPGAACDRLSCVVPGTGLPEELGDQSRDSDDLRAVSNIDFSVNLVERDLSGSEPRPFPKESLSDPRSLKEDDVYSLVSKVCLPPAQRKELHAVLLKYLNSLTTRPGKCKLLEYKFRINTDQPIVSYSRPVPFSLRPAVESQISQMMADKILEFSNSHILNPLTTVKKEDGKIRICVDARKVNQMTIPDHERAPPIQELLQRFHGVHYLTSLDLSSAFLQVPLDKESRPFTAFIYNSTVYQYTRVPYGFKNSLPAFIRAIKLALGGNTLSNVVFYVDDILIYSKTFDEHMKHIDAVLGKLTKAGFTINAKKCRFCREEVKFLGHRIDRTGVSADPDRVAAILNYPEPRNSKQLRQFLGTCNFHSRFIVGYANYVAPLTPLLKPGVKWKWTQGAQDAFLRLRDAFAQSIHLVHRREELPYAIYTDASNLGISSILTQVSESGETLVVSTASRVLSPAERRYSTCEQELLAVVNALKKFRI
jgi:hypothetical protein